MINKFKEGDIIAARARNLDDIKMPDGVILRTRPWELGVVVFAHPEHGFIVYTNGLYNQSVWCSEAYPVEDWKQMSYHSKFPVRTNGFDA